MRIIVRLLVVVLALLAAFYAYRWWFPDDERRIRTRLDDLAATVSESSGEGLAAVARAATLGSFFADDVVVDLGPPFQPIVGRDTIMALAAKAQVPGEGFSVSFVDVDVLMSGDRSSAQAHLTAAVRGRRLGDLEAIDARELMVGFKRIDGEWRIDRVTGLQALERPR